MSKKITLFFVLFCISLYPSQEYYSILRKKYWEYEENDSRAFTYIDLYIATAKKEKNFAELFQAYEDAVRYSLHHKLEYADSAISAAKLSENRDIIGYSHIGKGSVYYFNYKRFQPALDEYLLAYHYLENSENKFLKYQNLYHIGVVKSYLGYYKETLEIFKECVAYFKPNTRAKIHSNLIFNNRKGYLNSLHQMIICYQHLGNYNEAEKLIKEGLKGISNEKEFYVEKSYFEKSKGISDFDKSHYDSAISEFNQSLLGLIKKNDFVWTSVAYFYRGLSYSKLGNEEKSLTNYKKVDSIFNKYNFILPEVRRNYEELIAYYRRKNDPKQELYYTKQLLKTDSIISTDFKLLSTRIHKEYDTKTLLEAKDYLEKNNFLDRYLLLLSSVIIILLAIGFFYWFKRKKEIQKQYNELLLKINSDFPIKQLKYRDEGTMAKSSKLDLRIIENLKKGFAEFEKNKGFLEKGITAGKLAIQLETNATYISQFMNEFKMINFNTYINTLRIEYATQKMYNDKNWRKYSVDAIANACGFSSRQSFSNIFYEQNGIRPADFLKKIKEELTLEAS